MTAINSAFEQTRRQASTFTTALTVIALLLGWGLKTFVENQTRSVTIQGVTAQVPSGWVVRHSESTGTSSDDPFQMTSTDNPDGANMIFTTWNPLHPERRYSVSVYPGGSETNLASTAAVRTLNRGTQLKLYRVLQETPITVNGMDGYKVNYAYVNPGKSGEVPIVIQGIDYYFNQGAQTLVITLEIDNGNPNDQLPNFLKFVETVGLGG